MSVIKKIFRLLPLPYFLGSDKVGETKLSGYIDTSIFSYITPLMITVLTVVMVVVAFNIETLYSYYTTNVPLNSLIIFLLLISLIQAFNNNFQLYKTALFLKLMEKMTAQSEVTERDANVLRHKLEKDTPLLNTKQMHSIIGNFETFGHPNFSDNDARIIKSKLGYRIRLRRSDVGFNTGILVMLGLLGTFLGLLKTIDSIGLAMASMSNIGGDGEVTTEQMTSFISALSEPLQGMGLAFSTSLFGLSGSLLVGFFNHLCGGAQDTFIEAVSRWVDNRIPKYDPEKSQDDASNKPPNADDLRTWLSGFVYLSVKTNKKIGALMHVLVEAIEEAGNMKGNLNRIAENQDVIANKVNEATGAIESLSGQGTVLVENVIQSTAAVSELRDVSSARLAEVSKNLEQSKRLLEQLSAQQREASSYAQVTSEAVGDFKDVYRHDMDEMKHSLKGMTPALEHAITESNLAAQGILRDISGQLSSLKETASDNTHREKLAEDLKNIHGLLQQMYDGYNKSLGDFSIYAATPEEIKLHLTRVESLLENLNKNQQQVIDRLTKLQGEMVSALEAKTDQSALTGMAAELQSVLDEINRKNEESFNNVFGLQDNSNKASGK